jgi:CheY-like chemotaxis protein
MTDKAGVSRRTLKILIADDDPAVVKAIANRCENIGFEVATATNGFHALIMARRRQPDVLIVDVNMPELDGLSVCARLLNPETKSIDVIVVSGSDEPETAIRCQSMGMFYGSKRSNFWNSIAKALSQIAPEMADRIAELGIASTGLEVPTQPRVLLVDDDPDIENFLSSRLAKYDVEMLYAPNASQAHRIACKQQPSVIVTDYFMPNGDASYLLGKLRSTPETQNIPVIVLTGRQLNEMTERSVTQEIRRHPGAVKVIRKSANTNELFEALQKYCGFHKKNLMQG